MSRIGKNAIPVPEGVSVEIDGLKVNVKGKLGQLSATLPAEVVISQDNGKLTVAPSGPSVRARAMWGMSRSVVNNLVVGVSEGFTKKLEISGVGYRAQMQGSDLVLQLGFSHEVRYRAPEGITIVCSDQTHIQVSGADRQRVGQTAAKIRSYRPPEPYKGKGVRYADEFIIRKEGKKK